MFTDILFLAQGGKIPDDFSFLTILYTFYIYEVLSTFIICN